MERNFPVILCELRKEKGLSQKDAAAKLGISQALLSHYEKGIRECGQSFLIKVADFYDVTCDYLLGRTKKKGTIQDVEESVLEPSAEDTKPTAQTLIKASAIINSTLANMEKQQSENLEMLFAMAVYKTILLHAQAGNLPKNWAGRAYVDGEVCCNPVYLGNVELIAYEKLYPNLQKNHEINMPIPEAVKTLVDFAESFILKSLAESTPPMPPEFFR